MKTTLTRGSRCTVEAVMGKKYKVLGLTYYIWIGLFVLAPLALLAYQSFFNIHGDLSLENYKKFFTSFTYIRMTLNSFWTAGLITLLTLVVAYPMAYALTKTRNKDLWILLMILPTWINLLLKAYAFIGLFSKKGVFFTWAQGLGLESSLLFTRVGFIIAASYIELPFMVLAIFRALEDIPRNYIIAAQDLGAGRFQVFTRVILPLSMGGVIAGCQAVFIPSLSLFLITRLIGGNKVITLGTAVEQHYLITRNWGMGSTLGLVLIGLMALIMGLTSLLRRKKDEK